MDRVPHEIPHAVSLNSLVHLNTVCVQCFQSPIIGAMFECGECDDFVLCNKCFDKIAASSSDELSKQREHLITHNFSVILNPGKEYACTRSVHPFSLRSSSPPVFSVTYEDERVLLDAMQINYDDVVLSICGSGDNILHCLIQQPKRIFACDLSRPQLSLLALKIAAIQHLSFENFSRLLGSLPEEFECRIDLFYKIAPFIESKYRSYLESVSLLLFSYGVTKWAITALTWRAQRAVFLYENRHALNCSDLLDFDQLNWGTFSRFKSRFSNLEISSPYFKSVLRLDSDGKDVSLPYLEKSNYIILKRYCERIELFEGDVREALSLQSGHWTKINFSNIFDYVGCDVIAYFELATNALSSNARPLIIYFEMGDHGIKRNFFVDMRASLGELPQSERLHYDKAKSEFLSSQLRCLMKVIRIFELITK